LSKANSRPRLRPRGTAAASRLRQCRWMLIHGAGGYLCGRHCHRVHGNVCVRTDVGKRKVCGSAGGRTFEPTSICKRMLTGIRSGLSKGLDDFTVRQSNGRSCCRFVSEHVWTQPDTISNQALYKAPIEGAFVFVPSALLASAPATRVPRRQLLTDGRRAGKVVEPVAPKSHHVSCCCTGD
jgi:hypothetical protein